MPAKRSLGTGASLTFIGALLVTTSFTVPAYAQIETVVVTAEKRAEDIQSVPIAVTAYTAADMAAHQVNGFKDIQFSTPNVSYTKTNFTSSNFQIRGIGTQVISGDAESGIAFNVNDVYLAAPPVDSGQFYDIESVQILRGPQSTLYGRGATGGTVNVFTMKPQLDAMGASFDASYGNYDSSEIKGEVNMPIINDQLGVRVAADWVRHDGYATNIFAGTDDRHPDSRDQWSARASIRWKPTDATTVDVVYEHGDENDTRMRAQKQLCHTDPTGVLGCLPDALADEPVNPNATFFNIPVSKQATTEVFGAGIGAGPAGLLGLFDLTQPYNPVAGAVPSGPRTLNSDFTPTLQQRGNTVSVEWKQKWLDWLDSTFVANYDDGEQVSQEAYTNSPGAPFARGGCGVTPTLDCSLGVLQGVLNEYAFVFGIVPPSYADPINGPYAFLLNPTHAGTLPTSNPGNLGVISGDINKYTNNPYAYDQSNGETRQYSADLRFNTDFSGPLNGMIAAYYLNTESSGDYYVMANTLDYGQSLFGAIGGPALQLNSLANGGDPALGAACATKGCIFGTPYYDNRTQRTTVESRAVYGEVYYDAIPDSLRVTGGLRYTEDTKDNEGRITIFNGYIPIGSSNNDAALAACNAQLQAEQAAIAQAGNTGLVAPPQAGCDFDPGAKGANLFEVTHRQFSRLTGRVAIDYDPHWDLTDDTKFYASYAKGYKAGGSNPGVQQGNNGGGAIPAFYDPESIDAYELGAKNTLLGGRLQANLDVWYYSYAKYQISSIIDNTSVNTNINAFLGGFEGEMLWAPSDAWQFNFNFDWTQSRTGNTAQIDPRNPTGGDPNTLLIKDGTLSATNAQNCVLYYHGANFAADFATLAANSGGVFFAPPGGTGALAQYGVAHSAYGICTADTLNGALAPLLSATNFATSNGKGGTLTGEPVNIDGNELANTPPYSLSFGAQYTMPVGDGFHLVTRADYYWQAPMFGRIFNGPADHINSWGVGSALITLNAPDNKWYVQGYVKNLFNATNTTGEYLTSSSSGLWTGVFYGDPRTYGIQVGARF
jgi:iron complex outermembrane recepter protein